VIHFVSEGTIEEGMLKLLSFKKSLFSGVLDGRENNVFFGGTRLKRFMESVEQATSPMQEETLLSSNNNQTGIQEISEKILQVGTSSKSDEKIPQEPTQNVSSHETWDDIIKVGMGLASKLGKLLSEQGSSRILTFDKETNQMRVNLTLPKPDTMQKLSQVMNVLGELVEGL